MAVDEASLQQEVVRYRVISSTQIATRTKAILTSLAKESENASKTTVVCLTAQAKVAGKLISIVEIVKRDLSAKGAKCFQYTALSSELVDIPRVPKAKVASGQESQQAQGDDESKDEDDAFETIGGDGSTKKRNVPVMIVYLSASSVKELRAEYGEQR